MHATLRFPGRPLFPPCPRSWVRQAKQLESLVPAALCKHGPACSCAPEAPVGTWGGSWGLCT